MEDPINQLYVLTEQLENVEIKQFVNEIEQIDQQLKYSQEFLLKEIQRLKQDLDINYKKLNYANELRDIDQITIKTFTTKFQNLTQLLADIKQKEINTWHLVQFLRVNTSRLWHMFESVTNSPIIQEIIYEDFEKLLNHSQNEKAEQTRNLILLEKEHGDLLIKLKEIQLNLEDFRTKILQITQDTNNMKFQIQNQQQINNHIHEQTSKKLNQLLLNTKDIQDYKFLINEIHYLLKLIFQIQTQIEIHNKSILIYQTKLEKYKQDLITNIINRTNCENQIINLQKIIHQQNQNLKQLKTQQIQILQNRQQFHQHIYSLENKKTQIINHQQQLLNTIKQTIIKNNLLKKEIFHSNNTIQNFNYSYQQLIKHQNKQQDITNNLHKTIEINERQLQMTKFEINQLTEQITQQNDLINSKENQIESYTKDLQNLENCLSTTYDELNNQHKNINESKTKMKLFKQKMHKFIVDEKPLIKEISHYQKQIIQNEITHNQLQFNLKQNEMRINQYKTIIAKLIIDCNENDRILTQENLLLKQSQQQTDKSKENIKKLNKNFNYSENNYQNLKEIFHYTENENKQLKQQYADLTFVVQLLGQRQALLNNQLKSFYEKLKYLSQQIKIIEQSRSDVDILHKYYRHLQSYNYQLHQSLSFTSQQYYEYLHSQSLSNQFKLEIKTKSNHIHYWHKLMISSPEKFNNISKLFLIKKKLVKKSNEVLDLKKIFYEKNTLYRYLNQIYLRRQKLIEKMDKCSMLKDQLMKQKKLRNEMTLNKDEYDSRTEKSITNLFRH